MLKKHGIVEWNKICEEKTNLYYNARKIKYGGDNLTLKEKDPNLNHQRMPMLSNR